MRRRRCQYGSRRVTFEIAEGLFARGPPRLTTKQKNKAPPVENFAWLPVGYKAKKKRPWPGLVDLSRIPSGVFSPSSGRSNLPRKCDTNIDKNRQKNRLFCRLFLFFPDVSDLVPKARKASFTKVWSQRALFFLKIAAPRAPIRALLQSYSANKQREPRRSVFPVM